MAKPVEFPEVNLTLGSPPGLEGIVQPLPVYRISGRCTSCWEFDEHELAEIQRTGKVWLAVCGGATQPPVYVTSTKDELI